MGSSSFQIGGRKQRIFQIPQLGRILDRIPEGFLPHPFQCSSNQHTGVHILLPKDTVCRGLFGQIPRTGIGSGIYGPEDDCCKILERARPSNSKLYCHHALQMPSRYLSQ